MRFSNDIYKQVFPTEPVTEVVETPVSTFKPVEKQTEAPVEIPEPVKEAVEVHEDGSNGDDPGADT